MQTITNSIRQPCSLKKEAIKDHCINKLTKSDLNLFYGVLEAAISTIHKDKIERLNLMIGHLWKTTYQGSDIESISGTFMFY